MTRLNGHGRDDDAQVVDVAVEAGEIAGSLYVISLRITFGILIIERID